MSLNMAVLGEYRYLVEWAGLVSVVTFVGSLILVPLIISRLPEDYFVRHQQELARRFVLHPVRARLVQVVRNCFGLIFFLAGVAMLVLPGQGIITIVIGISLLDLPRKHALLDALVRRPGVRRVLNWIRAKENKAPFRF